MEPEKVRNNRLTGLDGLRGIAILLVFLTHINAAPILNRLPPSLRFIGETFFSSGVIGVSILFILCGFLMAYLYPQPDTISFLQKRYSRIFPLFITMSTVMAIFRFNSTLSAPIRLVIIIAASICGYLIWMGIKKVGKPRVSRILFYSFVALQLSAGCFYAFYIMRQPALVFNSQMPKLVHHISVWMVNTTLTLPLGNYIAMLDGVYWSLAAEVLFYVLYPTLFVPLIQSAVHSSRLKKIVLLITIIPFLVGADIISHRILGLSMLQLPLFYYFITGIVLAYIYRNYESYLQKAIKNRGLYIVGKVSLILFVVTLFLVRNNLYAISSELNPWARMFWAIPLTFFVGLAILPSTQMNRFLSNKILVYLGKISYSLYLSHTAVVEIMKEWYTPQTMVGTFVFICISLMLAISVATILQYFLERPYFMGRKSETPAKKSVRYYPWSVATFLLSAYIIFILIAYQSNFNFFSIENPYGKKIIISPSDIKDQIIRMDKYKKISLELVASENNLGILAFHLQYFQISRKVNPVDNWQKIQIRLKEKNANSWYAVSDFSPVQIGDSEMLPFGFPQISDSRGKTYFVELQLMNDKSNNSIMLYTDPAVVSAVYQADKKVLIKNPLLLSSHISKRMSNAFTHPQASMVTLYSIPFFWLIGIILVNNQSRRRA